MPLTRLQLVDEALEQAGLDSGYRDKGRLWLNIVLEKLSTRTNYLSNRTFVDASFVAGQFRYTVPTDFLRIDTMFLLNSSGDQVQVISVKESYQADPARTRGAGFPSIVQVDTESDELVFNSAPSSVAGEKYRLFYFKEAPQYSLNSTDDPLVVDFDDQWTLLEEMKALAYEWNEDAREGMKKAEAKHSSKDYQRNMQQSDSNSVVPLNNEIFRKRSRRN